MKAVKQTKENKKQKSGQAYKYVLTDTYAHIPCVWHIHHSLSGPLVLFRGQRWKWHGRLHRSRVYMCVMIYCHLKKHKPNVCLAEIKVSEHVICGFQVLKGQRQFSSKQFVVFLVVFSIVAWFSFSHIIIFSCVTYIASKDCSRHH